MAYLPGSREAVQKVKGEKTADCVVMGVTWSEKGTGIASLFLGLYDKDKLIPVGSAPASGKKRAEILERVEPLLGSNPERLPRGAPSRWKPKADLLEWSPISPELVVEVRYDKWQKGRFRHNSRFLRFRPDKDPDQCTVAQVRPRPKKGDPTVPGYWAADHGESPFEGTAHLHAVGMMGMPAPLTYPPASGECPFRSCGS